MGAYGTVMRCQLPFSHAQKMGGINTLAVKLLELPKTIYDRCVVHDNILFTGRMC